MQFPEAGCPAWVPWQPLLSWWLKQTSLLWDKNSQSEFLHSVLKYGQENLELLKVVWVPKKVEVIHCQGHQKGETTAVWGNWKAESETKQAAPIGQTSASPTAALFPCPLSELDPWYSSQEQAWFQTRKEIFYWTDGGSLLTAILQFQSHWLPHLLNSSMKEFPQGKQLLRPRWSSIFMSPSSPAYVRQYVKCVVCVPKTIPSAKC
jgi:hypothetical protein